MEKKKAKKDTKKEVTKTPTVKFDDFVIHTAVYKTKLTEKFKNRKPYEATDPKMILSEIPGTVLQIFVKKGQKVEKGEMLLELEAMKMYNKILAPEDGVIKAIKVKTGDRIPKNTIMLELK